MMIKKALAAMLLLLAASSVNMKGQDFNGSWNGVIELGPSSLTIVFNIQQSDAGVSITWDIPEQGGFDLPATATISGNELNVNMSTVGATFKGILKDETIEGTFSQRGGDYPLNMTQKEDVRKQRPQEAAIEADTNKPYCSEEVTFKNGDITFAATLTMPKTGKCFPAVVLVAGSGVLDRDEENDGHKPFMLLADALSRNGFAVLRYDERGGYATQGGYPFAPSTDLATDAMAALRYLKTRPEVDATQIGIVGHSEGGVIAVMCAAQHPDEVAYIVSMAGMGVNGYELGMQQARQALKVKGVVEPPESYVKLNEEKYGIIYAERDSVTLRNKLQEFVTKHASDPMLQVITGGADLERYLNIETNPMVRCVFQYDPTENLKRVKCPMLAINGTLDFQVACEENLNAIARLVPHATVTPYEGLNHFFQTCDDWVGSSSYAIIPETMSPIVLKDIVEWLKNTVKK